MFTGIVEELGTVKKIKKGANSAVFTIRAEKILDDLKTGDSVAVNGICLTVTACLEDGFTADVMHETLNRSALIQLSLGQHVNLERAMPANGRFGGHIVAGHVDGTGKITEIRRDDNAVWYTIQASPQIMKYIVTKGSVTVDGISLTVAKVSETDFSIEISAFYSYSKDYSPRRTQRRRYRQSGDRHNWKIRGKINNACERTADKK